MGPWYLDASRAEEIWERSRGEGVTVAVIDSGVDTSVPELQGRLLEGTDLTWEAEGADADRDGHGTAIASLIAGSGADGGVRGLAPEATILPIRVVPTINETNFDFDVEQRMVDAVAYAVQSGARILNISLGMEEVGYAEEELDMALAAAAREDVLIFASAGNRGDEDNIARYPGNREGVVGVAAVDPDGGHAAYSTYGPHVAIAAPGTDIPTRCEPGSSQLCLTEGTSYASALASASAALIWSAHPDWTKNQVLRALIGTAAGGGERDEYVGYGMIQPARVIVDGEGDPGDPDVNPLFEEYEASIQPPVSAEPSPAEEEGGQGESAPQDDGGKTDAVEDEAEEGVAVADEGGSGGSGTWAVVGVVGAAVVIGGAALAAANRRRRQRLGTVYAGRPHDGVGDA
ncbi:hypothetical protein GCM10022245_48080 [Streptomyces mayteni]